MLSEVERLKRKQQRNKLLLSLLLSLIPLSLIIIFIAWIGYILLNEWGNTHPLRLLLVYIATPIIIFKIHYWFEGY